jgi:hypothetical protein
VRGNHQRALFAMKRIAQPKSGHPPLEVPDLFVAERSPVGSLFNRKVDAERRARERFLIERTAPIQIA